MDMKYLVAILWLSFNFIKAALQSGFTTARIILWSPKNLNSGFCEMHYSELDGYQLILLGMLITLTPGSTLISINREQKTLQIHLLDLSSQQQTIQQIQHDYIAHLNTWNKKSTGNKET